MVNEPSVFELLRFDCTVNHRYNYSTLPKMLNEFAVCYKESFNAVEYYIGYYIGEDLLYSHFLKEQRRFRQSNCQYKEFCCCIECWSKGG